MDFMILSFSEKSHVLPLMDSLKIVKFLNSGLKILLRIVDFLREKRIFYDFLISGKI